MCHHPLSCTVQHSCPRSVTATLACCRTYTQEMKLNSASQVRDSKLQEQELKVCSADACCHASAPVSFSQGRSQTEHTKAHIRSLKISRASAFFDPNYAVDFGCDSARRGPSHYPQQVSRHPSLPRHDSPPALITQDTRSDHAMHAAAVRHRSDYLIGSCFNAWRRWSTGMSSTRCMWGFSP